MPGSSSKPRDGHTRAVTSHAGLLVTDPARIYLAPEALTLGPDADSSVDVFSFGTVSYFILTGRPPAATPQELSERAQAGISLSAVLDGVPESLEMLVLPFDSGRQQRSHRACADVAHCSRTLPTRSTRPRRRSQLSIRRSPRSATISDLGSPSWIVSVPAPPHTRLLVELDGVDRVLEGRSFDGPQRPAPRRSGGARPAQPRLCRPAVRHGRDR